MLKHRIITAAILLPIALIGFFLLEGLAFALFIGLVVVLGGWEWARLAGFEAQAVRILYAAAVGIMVASDQRGLVAGGCGVGGQLSQKSAALGWACRQPVYRIADSVARLAGSGFAETVAARQLADRCCDGTGLGR